MVQQRSCGFVIFRRSQGTVQYLMLKPSLKDYDHWGPPKGHKSHFDKSDMETAIRETQEETGFVPSDLKIFKNVKQEMTYQDGGPKIVICWLAELLNLNKSVKISREHEAFKWLPLCEACNLAKYPEMQKVLREFDKYICKNLL